MNCDFWQMLDSLVASGEIIIDRPRGSVHPRYPQMIYPLDYGYLKNTSSMDGEGFDVWVGTEPLRRVDAIVCTVDMVKQDSEIKILIGCTEEQKQAVMAVHNNSTGMKGILVRREEETA
ncbi:MAG: inorganic pyrophosphatase [Clostridia bacterium]|nr:inorganic pyrophosphatase [Clostridia bacterium]